MGKLALTVTSERAAGDAALSLEALATIEEASTVVVVVSAAHGAGDPTATEAIVSADAIDAADPTGPATKTTTATRPRTADDRRRSQLQASTRNRPV